MKAVSIIGYAFDCLPGHVQISARGSGSNLRAAVGDAVRNMLKNQKLYRKHVNDFKMSVVVIKDNSEAA